MNYTPSEEELQMLKRHTKHLYCKLELLDKDMNLLDSLEGLTIDGDINIDATSDIRRTFSATIHLDKKSDIAKMMGEDWANKLARIHIGMKTPTGKKIYWYSQGIYAFNQNGFKYSDTEHTLSISCVDLTAKLDGTLGGTLTGQLTKIPKGSDIGDSIVKTYRLSGMQDCVVNYWKRTVPYDLEFSTGSTIWSIIKELRDLYYPFETYFDDTVFVCNEITTGYDAPLAMSNKDFEDLVISEDCTYDYSQIKNCVELWGASVQYDVFADKDSVTVQDNGDASVANITASLTSSGSVSSSSNFSVGFVTPKTAFKKKLTVKVSISGTTFESIVYESETTKEGKDVELVATNVPTDRIVVIEYNSTTKKFYYKGLQQVHVMVKLVDEVPSEEEQKAECVAESCNDIRYVCLANPEDLDWADSAKFSIEKLGRRNEILSGGEYDNYDTTAKAMNCAEYKHWTLCRLSDSVSVECLLVPWLDVNQKLSYIPKYIDTHHQPLEYLIKSISISLGSGTMTMNMSRYWPYYPYIVQNKY